MTRTKAKPLQEALRAWPAERRKRVEDRARDLAAEYLTLQDLRKAQALTQERLADLLGIKQENVSRIEQRSDLLLSTLRNYVAALGGELELVARFPNRPVVVLTGLSDLLAGTPQNRARRRGKSVAMTTP